MTTPTKISDGVYFLALRDPKIQLNGVNIDSEGKITDLSEGALLKLSQADENLINQAKVNCEAWFGKKLSDEFLENVYDSALQDGNRLSAVFAKSQDSGAVLTRVFSEKRELVPFESVTGPFDAIVELYGIQFIRRGYSPVWRILQVRERPKPKPEIPEEYMFQDE